MPIRQGFNSHFLFSSISLTPNPQIPKSLDLQNKKAKKIQIYRKEKMDALDSVFDPLRDFAKDSVRLVKRCHKPDRKEFTKVATRTAIGFVVMGFVGFFVKLIFIPINNIIVGAT
ncbi:hypothetical protein MIMGU_mgv1a016610mg [Erythranthe guttata]|uniref:Protein transport protein Sec61 subunit gamma n=1 Tax=Erythranthe guttata TaxID=4155 RepID=A0A022RST3_ERYGU|nr:hypothetical protein MIMGU_mgv1a016610mg [Erythranthe guttata]